MARHGQSPTPSSDVDAAPLSRRASWGTISREQVIVAATRIVKSGGFDSMTIRSLAQELGVAPMSLYRHVRDKGDLLDEVVDRLLAEVWRPRASKADWRTWITEAADRLRRFLVRQPAALDVYLRHPVVSPAAVARMHAMLGILHDGLGDEASANAAYATIHTYTLGFAALEASRSGWVSGNASSDDPVAVQLMTFTTPSQFAVGMRYLLSGLEQTNL